MKPILKPILKRNNAEVSPPKKKRKKKGGWRFQGKKLLATYPLCDLSPEEALACLLDVLSKWEPYQWRVAREHHEDRTLHIHAVMGCKRTISTTNARFADLWRKAIDGAPKRIFHGRYEKCRSFDAVKQYLTKEGDYIDNIEPSIAKELLDLAAEQGVHKAMLSLREKRPEQFLREGKRIKSNLGIVAPPPCGLIRSDFTFIEDEPAVVFWKAHSEEYGLWMKGDSGVGKTSFALTLLGERPLVVSHVDQLKTLVPSFHTGILFDDVSFLQMTREQALHYTDLEQDRGIHIRYGVAVIPAKMKRIFVSNTNIFPSSDLAFKRRLVGYTVTKDLRVQEQSGYRSIHHPYEPEQSMFQFHDDYFVYPQNEGNFVAFPS